MFQQHRKGKMSGKWNKVRKLHTHGSSLIIEKGFQDFRRFWRNPAANANAMVTEMSTEIRSEDVGKTKI